ncbi:hypothetical protein CAOG_07594 [Capsaspora owczarzaki ATCC 30864]|uniref:ADF-H domain-containing protein n=1 Tax=Capsaspora owczarzaki (strain ATCC 30864) TaxID=595528 RepID=A0A0D2WW40_CAPO3|nr:hypothetical protein CAOG_07594 [Capsaspora owczarzaki ATCC 30864]KJE97130.1 hypothetical protein CAOG_007594 [Capsaspora owczarzaki ATCC 30864]|eukprot:XP_004343468.2 hypothetical protein CAOG_07594 [Capsaspora owczarzaki ATCC 30864]
MSVRVVDEGRALETLALLRNPHTDLNWAFFASEEKDTITLSDFGVGGVDQLACILRPNVGGYALTRVKQDGVWRYCYITWMGDAIPSMKKAEVAKNMAVVSKFLGNFDLEMLVSHMREMTEANVTAKVREALTGEAEEPASSAPATAPRRATALSDEPMYIDHSEVSKSFIEDNQYESLDGYKPYQYGEGNVEGGDLDIYGSHGYSASAQADLYAAPQDYQAATPLESGDNYGYDGAELYEAPQVSDPAADAAAAAYTEQYRQYLALLSAVSPAQLQDIYGTATQAQAGQPIQYQQLLSLMQTAQQQQQMSKIEKTVDQNAVIEAARQVKSSVNATGLGKFASVRGAPRSSTNVSGEGQQVQILDQDKATAAVKSVRDEKSATSWVLLGYEGKSVAQLRLLATGNAIEDIRKHVSADIVAYALARLIDRSEAIHATRYAFVTWMGDNVPAPKKAKVAVNKSSILAFLGHYNVDVLTSDLNELSESVLLDKQRSAGKGGSGSGPVPRVANIFSKPSETPTAKPPSSPAPVAPTTPTTPTAPTSTAASSSSAPSPAAIAAAKAAAPKTLSGEGKKVSVIDMAAASSVVQQIRSDTSTLNWVLFGYEGKSVDTICMLGSGSGGVEELAKLVNQDMVGYGLVKIREDAKGGLAAPRFAQITWMGDNLPGARKAKVAVNKSSVSKFLGHYNLDMLVSDKAELTTANFSSKFSQATAPSGNTSAKPSAVAAGASPLNAQQPAKRPNSVVGGGSGGFTPKAFTAPKQVVTTINHVNFVDVDNLKAEIAEVRNDSKPKNWTLLRLDERNSQIILLGSGEGGLKQMRANLKDDMAAFGLLRQNVTIKGVNTVRFAFINLIGEKLPMLIRGKISSYHGAVVTLMDPYHVDLTVRNVAELTDELVLEKLNK